MSMVKNSNAQLFLFLNAFLWGSSYVWSKMLLGYLPRFSILFLCSLGGLVSTYIMFHSSLKSIDLKAAFSSVGVSIFSILSNTFCMLSLQYTSSSNTAFIVQMTVIITPVIMAFLERKMPKKKIVISAVIAMVGVFLLTCDLGSFKLNIGDLLALGNAIFFSLFLVGVTFNSKKVNAVQFTFIHHITNTIAFAVLAGVMEVNTINFYKLESPIFAILITLSICIAVFTVLFQSAAIKYVRPEKATMIYTLEPVTALMLAFLFIGESLDGINAVIGCLLILSSVVYSIYKPRVRKEYQSKRVVSKTIVWRMASFVKSFSYRARWKQI